MSLRRTSLGWGPHEYRWVWDILFQQRAGQLSGPGVGVSLRAGSRCLPLAVNNLSTGKINDDSWLKICYLIMVPPEKKPAGCF